MRILKLELHFLGSGFFFSAAYKQPILYNLAVAREIVKKVYIAEGLQPPTWEAAKAAYTSMYADATSRAFWKNVISSGEYGRIGVYGVQAYGIFKVCVLHRYQYPPPPKL